MQCYKPWSEEYIAFIMGILTLGKCATETVNALALLISENKRGDILTHLQFLQQTRTLSLVELLWKNNIGEALQQACLIMALDAAITHADNNPNDSK